MKAKTKLLIVLWIFAVGLVITAIVNYNIETFDEGETRFAVDHNQIRQ